MPGVYRIEFDEQILASSVVPADLSVNGMTPNAVNVIGNVLEFDLSNIPEVEGVYNVSMAAAAVTDLQGMTLASPFAATFSVDLTAPIITSTLWNGVALPGNKSLAPGPLTFQASLSEDLFVAASPRRGPRSPGADDIRLVENFTGETLDEDGISYNPTTDEFIADYNHLDEGEYTLTLVSGPGSFEDVAGNFLDGEPQV